MTLSTKKRRERIYELVWYDIRSDVRLIVLVNQKERKEKKHLSNRF